jgi:hypothetical protein
MPDIIHYQRMHNYKFDGSGSQANIARAAVNAGLDMIIVTAQSALVNRLAGYYQQGNPCILVMIREEINDQARQYQKNIGWFLARVENKQVFAHDPQLLLDSVD